MMGAPKKLKAPRLNKKQKKALAQRKIAYEQAAARKQRDEEQVEIAGKQPETCAGPSPKTRRGRPPTVDKAIVKDLFDSEIDVTDAQFSGQAPPDLERFMRAKTRSLPTRARGSSSFHALDRKEWPSCAVPSPSDYFFRSQKKCFGPPSTTYFVDPSLFGVRPVCNQCDTAHKTVP